MQTFIYPYKQKSAQGDELKYSLRSLCQNFKEDFKVVIVGDKPEWLSDNARVIAGDFDKSKNPAINVAEKLLKILKDPKIPFNFTWMNDDIYFVNTVTIEDIIKLKTLGKYDSKINYTKETDVFQSYCKAAMDWLFSKGKESLFVYTTHLPFYFNKTNWKNLLKEIDIMKSPYSLTNLYHNWFFDGKDAIKINHRDNISAGVYRILPQEDAQKLKQHLDKTKFFTHSPEGFCSVVIEELKKRFSEKCKFEN